MNAQGYKYVATTPKTISDAIRRFCSQLSKDDPVFLNVQPSGMSRPGMCYANATQVANGLKGKVVFGWLVWELDGVYLTAEHHAIAEANGKLIDVTPQIAGERTVLFVPDRVTDFHPPRPANKYVALVNHTLIEKYVSIARTNSELELVGKAFGFEHTQNDRRMTRLLDLYLSRSKNEGSRKALRKKKRNQRRRKKRAR